MISITREEYEAECVGLGFVALSDSELIEFAQGFDSRNADVDFDVVETGLKVQRGYSAEIEMMDVARVAVRKAWGLGPSAPTPGGQIWDGCENCGMEPVYTPLMLCSECWPRG